jgi:carnitine 3-dehydrogenase
MTKRPEPGAVRNVACIGGGTIGGGWAAFFLSRGLDVVVADPHPDAERHGRAIIAQAWPYLESLGLAPGADPERIRFTASIGDAVRDAEFVQESAPERAEVKAAIFREIDAHAGPEIVVASSSSRLLPEQFTDGCRHPERCVIGHPFAPSYLIPLVEIVGSAGTSEDALAWAAAFYAAIGKKPLRLKQPIQAFIANRLQYAIADEANRLVEGGVCDYADIDDAIIHSVGLRWAFLGPAVGFHLGGGKGGFDHCLQQFGWRGSQASCDSARAAAEAVAETRSIEDLERWRDENLVRLLKARATLS